MARKKTNDTVGPPCWTGSKFVSMPEDLTIHAAMTIEEIEKQPEIIWSEETNRWEFK